MIGDAVRPTRQEGFFFGAPQGSKRYKAGELPAAFGLARLRGDRRPSTQFEPGTKD